MPFVMRTVPKAIGLSTWVLCWPLCVKIKMMALRAHAGCRD